MCVCVCVKMPLSICVCAAVREAGLKELQEQRKRNNRGEAGERKEVHDRQLEAV